MRRSLIVGIVVTLLLLPIAAYAANQFVDVPSSNVFHDAIDWMRENKITLGCNPPANDKYCPNNPVTRGQMAAFMKRLADNEVVDAAALGGAAPQAFRSRGGAIAVDATFGQVASIAHMTGFTVPANGGALIASADVSFIRNSGMQLGVMYLEFDGSGACTSNPVIYAFFETQTSNYDSSSTSLTKAVSKGDHRVDLCAGGLSVNTTNAVGSLTVQWVETSEGGVTALAGTKSLSSILSELADKLDLDPDQ